MLIINAVVKLWKKAVIDAPTFIIFAAVFVLAVFTNISPVIFVVLTAIAGIILKSIGVKK